MLSRDMPPDSKDQKTAILQDMPPEVAAAAAKRNVAAPGAPPPASSAATMMLDAAQHPVVPPQGAQQSAQRPVVVPTMMQQRPSGNLPPVRGPEREPAYGRWIVGPIIAAVVAGGTYFGANAAMPLKPKVTTPEKKPQGHLKLQTDPPGASIVVDGKVWPHFTPTVVDADIGATLHVVFKLDGYKDKDTDVYIAEGEHPFNAKLEKAAPVAPPTPAPVEPTPAPVAHEHEHHHHSSTAAPASGAKGSISIFVRPWAIVYVDGSRLRQTPVQSFELPSGKHTVELVNEGKNRREKIQVTIKAGEPQEIRRDWDK